MKYLFIILLPFFSNSSDNCSSKLKEKNPFAYNILGRKVLEKTNLNDFDLFISKPQDQFIHLKGRELRNTKKIALTDKDKNEIGQIKYGLTDKNTLYIDIVKVSKDKKYTKKGLSTLLITHAVLNTQPDQIMAIFTGDNLRISSRALSSGYLGEGELITPNDAIEKAPLSKSLDKLLIWLPHKYGPHFSNEEILFEAMTMRVYEMMQEMKKNKNSNR